MRHGATGSAASVATSTCSVVLVILSFCYFVSMVAICTEHAVSGLESCLYDNGNWHDLTILWYTLQRVGFFSLLSFCVFSSFSLLSSSFFYFFLLGILLAVLSGVCSISIGGLPGSVPRTPSRNHAKQSKEKDDSRSAHCLVSFFFFGHSNTLRSMCDAIIAT